MVNPPGPDQHESSSPAPSHDKSNNNLGPDSVKRDLVLKDLDLRCPTRSTYPDANITINTKPFLCMANESVSSLNPYVLTRTNGLTFKISRQEDNIRVLICYDHLARLADFEMSRITLQKTSEILGALCKPSPMPSPA